MSEGKEGGRENLERMVSLAKGPQGDQGEQGDQGDQGTQGERGVRGLSRIQGRAVVVLFLLAALLGVSNWWWTDIQIAANNHKFCQVIVSVVPVPRPSAPAANPSRETAYEQYEKFAGLGRSLGCGGAP
jgi:hypothetical protein